MLLPTPSIPSPGCLDVSSKRNGLEVDLDGLLTIMKDTRVVFYCYEEREPTIVIDTATTDTCFHCQV